jgi:protein gp37
VGEITAISWCDHTFNPWIGCMKVSPACDGCYAEAMMDKRYGRVQWGAPGQGPGTRVRTSAGNWHQPILWNKRAIEAGTRPFVFCASLADVFDNQVPPEWRADLFRLIEATPRLVWLLLTKRPQNIVRMVKEIALMPSNIAFGTTVEDRERTRANLPHLTVAAGLRPLFLFASCEPLLGDLGDLSPWMRGDPQTQSLAEGERFEMGIKIGADRWPKLPAVGWWITGGETDQGGHKARPTHPLWVRSIRDQAIANGLAYHHKQNGEWARHQFASNGSLKGEVVVWPNGRTDVRNANDGGGPGVDMDRIGKHRSGRLLDGIEHNARPEIVA